MELVFDINKVKTVLIEQVRPNTWNPKEAGTPEYERVKKGLQTEGQRLPIVVRDNNGFEIIDGEQRFTAMKELGATHIVVYDEGVMDDAHAKALTIWYEQQVPFEDVSLAKLISELNDLNVILPYNEKEIADFVQMANFDFEQYNQERPDAEDGQMYVKIPVTQEQFDIVENALTRVKSQYGYDSADALVYLCSIPTSQAQNTEQITA